MSFEVFVFKSIPFLNQSFTAHLRRRIDRTELGGFMAIGIGECLSVKKRGLPTNYARVGHPDHIFNQIDSNSQPSTVCGTLFVSEDRG